jgi:hypothetical protein
MYTQIPVEKDRNKNSQKMFVESQRQKNHLQGRGKM